MALEFIEKEGKLVIKITESLDSLNAQETGEEIEKRISNFDGDVIFDFEDLDYISSAGLQVLLMTAKSVNKKGYEVFVSKPKDMVDEVLKISGFYSFLKKEK